MLRKLLLALAFMLFANHAMAQAGTISIQVTETGQTTLTKTYSIPDAQIDRLVAAYQVAANASVNAPATRTQVLNYWASQLMQATVQYVQGIESQNATAAATATVTPINPQ